VISDAANNNLRRVDFQTRTLGTLGGSTERTWGLVDGMSHDARFMPLIATSETTTSIDRAPSRTSTSTKICRYRAKPSETVDAATMSASVIAHPVLNDTQRGNT
jgi:hypothetical protein